jgi:hypothetical protein
VRSFCDIPNQQKQPRPHFFVKKIRPENFLKNDAQKHFEKIRPKKLFERIRPKKLKVRANITQNVCEKENDAHIHFL